MYLYKTNRIDGFNVYLQNTVIRTKKSSKLEFEIVNESGGKEEVVVLRAETSEERDQWTRHLQQHIHNLKRYGSQSC